ncbi:MAG: hypothetical protein WBL54_10540 [Nitrososphaeraceae archaeon]
MPFPIGLGVMLIAIFSINIVRAEIRLRKTGVGGIKGWYKSFSSSAFGHSGSNSHLYTPIKFYCMNCSNEHRKIACPNCGSKAVKAG